MKPIHEMTVEEKCREVAEWLGLGWHDEGCIYCGKNENDSIHIQYGNDIDNPIKHYFEPIENIDFTEDPGKIQLLREMEKGEYGKFMDEMDNRYVISTFFDIYLDDTTGKLLDAVLEWKRREK